MQDKHVMNELGNELDYRKLITIYQIYLNQVRAGNGSILS